MMLLFQWANIHRSFHKEPSIKILLLGSGESGKTTLLNQMKIMYGPDRLGFSDEEREDAIKLIHKFTIQSTKQLLRQCKSNNTSLDQTLVQKILSVDDKAKIDEKLGHAFKQVWKDPGVQSFWTRRSKYQLQDALSWFLNHIDRIAQPDYLPSNQDMIFVRQRTRGITETTFDVKGAKFVIIDVGGQRSERKKWIHCFDQVTAVLFVAAISEYDQTLQEDHHVNRQEESLRLFSEICESKWFHNSIIILFLNKRDLFREKLQYTPFKIETGPDARNQNYNGPVAEPGTPSAIDGTTEFEHVYRATTRYLKGLYREAGNSGPVHRDIHIHVTDATDTTPMQYILRVLHDAIITQALVQSQCFV